MKYLIEEHKSDCIKCAEFSTLEQAVVAMVNRASESDEYSTFYLIDIETDTVLDSTTGGLQ